MEQEDINDDVKDVHNDILEYEDEEGTRHRVDDDGANERRTCADEDDRDGNEDADSGEEDDAENDDARSHGAKADADKMPNE